MSQLYIFLAAPRSSRVSDNDRSDTSDSSDMSNSRDSSDKNDSSNCSDNIGSSESDERNIMKKKIKIETRP